MTIKNWYPLTHSPSHTYTHMHTWYNELKAKKARRRRRQFQMNSTQSRRITTADTREDEKKMKQIRHKYSNALGRIWIIEPESWKRNVCARALIFCARACVQMRPIMMRCRANNIMFNKQTTALGFCNKNRSRFGHKQSRLLLLPPLPVLLLLFTLLRVKILLLIIYTHFYMNRCLFSSAAVVFVSYVALFCVVQ